MGAEEVQGEEERPVVCAGVRRVPFQRLDGPGGQVVLEGGLDRLVEPCRQQVAGAAVGQGAADPVADLVRRQSAFGEVREVVGVVDGVVPAGEFGTVEAVVGGGAPAAGVPLADEAAVVAPLAQRPGEGELLLGQVLQVADVAFVVGEELVAEGGLAGQQTGPGRGADRGGCVPAVEPGSRGGQFVQYRGVGQSVAVGAERVRPVLVGHEEEDVLPGRARPGHWPAPVKRSPV